MIDLTVEKLVSLREAAALLPRRRSLRPTHPATLYRWATRGVRGQRLETIRVGGTLCTSIEALQRFFESLTPESGRTKISATGAHGREF